MEYNNILRESWASYVGWELTHAYYKSFGWQKRPEENISGCAAQGWEKGGRDSSPLFADLKDDYNQRYGPDRKVYPNSPNDYIYIDPLLINELGKVGNWSNFKTQLKKHLVDRGYSSRDFDQFIVFYDR